MSPLIRKLQALLSPDPEGQPLAPETRRLIEEAIRVERCAHTCTRCGETLRGSDAAFADCGVSVTCGLCRDDMRNGR